MVIRNYVEELSGMKGGIIINRKSLLETLLQSNFSSPGKNPSYLRFRIDCRVLLIRVGLFHDTRSNDARLSQTISSGISRFSPDLYGNISLRYLDTGKPSGGFWMFLQLVFTLIHSFLTFLFDFCTSCDLAAGIETC